MSANHNQDLSPEQRAILEAVPVLDAEAVRRYVAAKWPQAMQSPAAVACAEFESKDGADRAVDFARLQAIATEAAAKQAEADSAELDDALAVRADAMAHAEACLAARNGWTVETLGHNIESAFGMELDAEECDEIARAAIAKATGSAA